MPLLDTQLLDSSQNSIRIAADIIKAGGVVAVPTETVYGLAADASNATAVNRIFEAKNRPNNHPLIIHIHSLSQLQQLAIKIPTECHLLAKSFWPGPLTMLLQKSEMVLDAVTGNLSSVGIRMPNHPVLKALLAQGDLYVAAPSANPHKKLSPTTAQQVFNELNGRIDAVIDGGPCDVGLESTIVDLTNLSNSNEKTKPSAPKILRAGPITRQQISASLGVNVQSYESHDHQVPGNIEQHYQPKGRLEVIDTEQVIKMLPKWPKSAACLWFSSTLEQSLSNTEGTIATNLAFKQIAAAKQGYAQALYNALYQLDQHGFSTIYVERPPQSEEWLDVNDRLNRAGA